MTEIGTGAELTPWTQVDRQGHSEWGKLIGRNPAAGSVLHQLVALMDRQNAVVISQGTLARMMGYNPRTIRRAIEVLRSEQWVQVVRIGGAGTVNAYVVNARVAWCDKRENLRYASFTAQVIADADDRPADDDPSPLRRIPVLFPIAQRPPPDLPE